jgi:RNA polymerase sigma-70 factor (ECF subfamily)
VPGSGPQVVAEKLLHPVDARSADIVDAFFAAARSGDFDTLVAVLDPDVVLRADGGSARTRPTVVLHGARAVAGQAVLAQRLAPFVRPVLVNGTAGFIAVVHGRVVSVMGFTVTAVTSDAAWC